MNVRKGSKVKVTYVGTLDDGTVFDSSEKHNGEPLEFTVGTGQVIKGFDDAVMGMRVGEEKTIHIPATEAYGDRKEELLQKVPRDKMPPGHDIKEGMMLLMSSPDGQHKMPVRVAAASATEVTLDLNHPLAGQALNFKIKITTIV